MARLWSDRPISPLTLVFRAQVDPTTFILNSLASTVAEWISLEEWLSKMTTGQCWQFATSTWRSRVLIKWSSFWGRVQTVLFEGSRPIPSLRVHWWGGKKPNPQPTAAPDCLSEFTICLRDGVTNGNKCASFMGNMWESSCPWLGDSAGVDCPGTVNGWWMRGDALWECVWDETGLKRMNA